MTTRVRGHIPFALWDWPNAVVQRFLFRACSGNCCGHSQGTADGSHNLPVWAYSVCCYTISIPSSQAGCVACFPKGLCAQTICQWCVLVNRGGIFGGSIWTMWRARDAAKIVSRIGSEYARREARVSRDLVQNLNKDRYSVVLKQVWTHESSWLWVCRYIRLPDGRVVRPSTQTCPCRMWKDRGWQETS